MKKYVTVLLLILAFSVRTYASGKHSPDSLGHQTGLYRGFSGGMILHAGYLTDKSCSDFSASGATAGIGGAVRIFLGRYFRIGSEGYVSTMPLKNDGYIKMGWGGLLADCYWHKGICLPYIGLTLGGGGKQELHLIEGSADDWEKETEAIFHKNPFFAVAPFIGCEFSVTEKLSICLKADYLLAIHKGRLSLPHGPRFYLGVVFGHQKTE